LGLDKFYKEYCSGCGLCKHAVGVQFNNKNGFEFPVQLNKTQLEFCKKVCPVNGINYNTRTEENLWGPSVGIYRGWSLEQEVRYRAASGGIITSVCLFLLETGKCDAILQVGSSDSNPFDLQLYSNSDRSAVIKCSSSKYITGLTYKDIEEKIQPDKRYAVVGKPCDIEALSNYMVYNSTLKESIIYKLTFFCAGAPSVKANEKMVKELGIEKEDVTGIRYRGNGWPGKATVITRAEEKQMEYIDSWNNILGRDIRKICKFCVNGTGMFADISCGDLWNLSDKNYPIFDEAEGQNIIFARTKIGENILQEACSLGYIHVEGYAEMQKLPYIQPNHYNMQTTMSGKIIGLKFCAKRRPKYKLRKLLKISKEIPTKKIIRAALGTIKRVIKGTV